MDCRIRCQSCQRWVWRYPAISIIFDNWLCARRRGVKNHNISFSFVCVNLVELPCESWWYSENLFPHQSIIFNLSVWCWGTTGEYQSVSFCHLDYGRQHVSPKQNIANTYLLAYLWVFFFFLAIERRDVRRLRVLTNRVLLAIGEILQYTISLIRRACSILLPGVALSSVSTLSLLSPIKRAGATDTLHPTMVWPIIKLFLFSNITTFEKLN